MDVDGNAFGDLEAYLESVADRIVQSWWRR
jgi:hypothetical protein